LAPSSSSSSAFAHLRGGTCQLQSTTEDESEIIVATTHSRGGGILPFLRLSGGVVIGKLLVLGDDCIAAGVTALESKVCRQVLEDLDLFSKQGTRIGGGGSGGIIVIVQLSFLLHNRFAAAAAEQVLCL
jgi:hypothetical protein